MKKALIHEASDAREIALSEMSSIAGAARIVCRVGAIACLVPAALGVVGCLQWAVGGMLDGSFAKGFILAGSRALSQAAASAGPELLSLTTPDKAASIILIDQNGSFPIARELSMLLMAWALAVAGRFFSEVASTKRPFGSVAARRVKRIGAIAVLASIAPSLVVLGGNRGVAGDHRLRGVAFHISGFPTVALRYGIFPVGVRPHSGIRRYLAATR